MNPTLMIIIGAVCFAAFAFLNFVVQPLWFPHELRDTASPQSSRKAQNAGARLHMVLGLFLALLLLVGLTLIAAGCVMIGTSAGYGPSR